MLFRVTRTSDYDSEQETAIYNLDGLLSWIDNNGSNGFGHHQVIISRVLSPKPGKDGRTLIEWELEIYDDWRE